MTKPERDLRVLLVAPWPPPLGGISHWTVMVERHASECGGVHIVPIDTAARWRAIHDKAIWKRLLGGGVQLVRNYASFLKVLAANPGVIHLATSGQLALVRDALLCVTARLVRVPLVYHIRFGRVPDIACRCAPEWSLMAWVMRRACVVMAIDRSTADTVTRLLPKTRVEYVPNPIDLSVLPGRDAEATEPATVLYLGWIIPTKGIEELVQAWTMVAPDGWQLLLVGPGKQAYQQDLISRHTPRNLHFVGELPHEEAMKVMAQCDIFVLPSYTEGFPNVILEAMTLARPIIATSVGAIPDMLSDDCGLLVEAKNVQELAGALDGLMRDPTARERFGRRGYAKVKQEYAIDVVFERYEEIWRSLQRTQT